MSDKEPNEDAKTIQVCDMIANDMAADASAFDGRPFNGKTVAEYFGHQGAAIAALAKIIKAEIERRSPYADLKAAVDDICAPTSPFSPDLKQKLLEEWWKAAKLAMALRANRDDKEMPDGSKAEK
jgi:hypothetical protein